MWEIWKNKSLPKALKKLSKVQLIAQSGHTDHESNLSSQIAQ